MKFLDGGAKLKLLDLAINTFIHLPSLWSFSIPSSMAPFCLLTLSVRLLSWTNRKHIEICACPEAVYYASTVEPLLTATHE